jgi:hypothetical protein
MYQLQWQGWCTLYNVLAGRKVPLHQSQSDDQYAFAKMAISLAGLPQWRHTPDPPG